MVLAGFGFGFGQVVDDFGALAFVMLLLLGLGFVGE